MTPLLSPLVASTVADPAGSVPIRTIGVVVAVAGVAYLAIAHLAAHRRIRPNRWVGIRTPETEASEEAWYAGQAAAVGARRVAGLGAVVLGLLMVWLDERGVLVNLVWIAWLVVWSVVAHRRAVAAARAVAGG